MKGKTNILIVDDDVSQCKTMSFVLRKMGCAVDCAYDGLKAIKEVKKRPFDVVFMDIKMPLMNGVETFKRMKKIRPGSAVIMMTAYADDGLVNKALEEGARGVMFKPLDMKKVIDLIKRDRKATKGRSAKWLKMTLEPVTP